jgi:hypothetical protein
MALLITGCATQVRVLDITELTPPRNVTAVVLDDQVLIRWSPSLDEQRADFAGYNLYVSPASLLSTTLTHDDRLPMPVVLGKVHEAALDNLEPGRRYFVQVRSRLKKGQLSVASLPEVVIEIPDSPAR